MNQQQLIEQKAKELLIQNCGTPTIGDNGEMTADLDYYIESDAALSTMIEFGEWMQGEADRLRECSNARKNEIIRLRELNDELAEELEKKTESASMWAKKAMEAGLERNQLAAELERLKGEREAPKWISVKDRLPEIDESSEWNRTNKIAKECLTYSPFGMRFGQYFPGMDHWNVFGVSSSESIPVTHWRMIEPPKPSNNG